MPYCFVVVIITVSISTVGRQDDSLCKADVTPIATNAPTVHPDNNEQEIALPAIFLFRRLSSFLGARIAHDVPNAPLVTPKRRQIVNDIPSIRVTLVTFIITLLASTINSGTNIMKRRKVIRKRYRSGTNKIELLLHLLLLLLLEVDGGDEDVDDEEDPKRPRTSPALNNVTTRIAYQSLSGCISIVTPGNTITTHE